MSEEGCLSDGEASTLDKIGAMKQEVYDLATLVVNRRKTASFKPFSIIYSLAKEVERYGTEVICFVSISVLILMFHEWFIDFVPLFLLYRRYVDTAQKTTIAEDSRTGVDTLFSVYRRKCGRVMVTPRLKTGTLTAMEM